MYTLSTSNEPASLQLYTDNDETVRRINLDKDEILPEVLDQDVWVEVKTVLDDLPMSHLATHVKAHQDDHTPLDQLNPPAYVNVMMDRMAGEKREESTSHPLKNSSPCSSAELFSCSVSIWSVSGMLMI